MSYETKQLAEKLIKLHNSTEILNDIISVLQSSENTVKEDIIKLIDGAKLEPQFDLGSLESLSGDVVSYVSDAESNISSARSYVEDAESSIGDAVSSADELYSMLEDIKYELQKDDESEGSDE